MNQKFSIVRAGSYAIFFLALSGVSTVAHASGWNDKNDPKRMNDHYNYRLADLPLAARLPDGKIPYSESYWPYYRSNIAHRWNSKDPQDFHYHSPSSPDAVRSMSAAQLAELSPAEKYDLFMGHYDYPTVKEIYTFTSDKTPTWEGMCTGWAPASILHPEPVPVTVTNPDGIQVPFGSSDVKALLAFYYARKADPAAKQVGSRCSSNIRKHSWLKGIPSCADVNAGALHVVLANQIGLMREAFIADVDRSSEVWNNPVFEYESTIVGRDEKHNRVLVETKMIYADDDEKYPQWEPVMGTPNFHQEKLNLKYWLELDDSGRITGGDWESYERPDFLWIRQKANFEGYFEGINQLLKK